MSANVNTTTNGTQLPSCSYDPTAAKIGVTIAYCLIFVVSLVGNSLIGIIVYKTRTMRKPINFLMVNMAMSDLLNSIFLIPLMLTETHAGSWLISGPLGQALCKLVFLLRDASAAVSVQSLVLIAVDRFGAVAFPHRSPLVSSKLCPFLILATWIVAMALWYPYLIANKLVEHPGGLACEGVWTGFLQVSSSYKNYILAIFTVCTNTPLVLVAIFYTTIYIKVRSLTIPDEQSANERQPLVRRERTVLKVATAIVLGSAVCLLPYSIVIILTQLVSDLWSCGFLYFAIVAFIMSSAFCAINPCILFLFSKNYRQSIRNLVRCFWVHSRGQMYRVDRKIKQVKSSLH